MLLTERLDYLSIGQPGAVVDEDITEFGKSCLYYLYYNENGDLKYYLEFWRAAAPEDIADLLNEYAAGLLESHPVNMTLEAVLDKVVDLRTQARNVPGLNNKFGG
jgi:hypothetical protein